MAQMSEPWVRPFRRLIRPLSGRIATRFDLAPFLAASPLEVVTRARGLGTNDAVSFVGRGVPALVGTRPEVHAHYHTPDDVASKIDAVDGAEVVPIRNPVTGLPHRGAIKFHTAFEFREAEMASANFWSRGELEQNHEGRFAALSYVTYGPDGIIDEHSHPAARP